MRAVAANSWTVLLLITFVAAAVAQIKKSGKCGDNELGICKKVDKCRSPFINWPEGSNICSTGETCCRRTISFGCTTENGQTCKFPFKYNKKWYEECTTDDSDHGKAWCSYEQDDFGKHVKSKYDVCNSNCTEIRCITCEKSNKKDQFYIHPSDCTKFLQCSSSGAKEVPCPQDTNWDQSALTCDATAPCVTAQYINNDGSCKTEGELCQDDHECRPKFITCRNLMCGTLPSDFRKHMKECAEEMSVELPAREYNHDHFAGDGHHETQDEVNLCGRLFRPNHPSQDGIMKRLDASTAAIIRKCILNKGGMLQSWDDLVNRGVMLSKLYTPFLGYPELKVPIKDAIEKTCQEPVDFEIHDFYRCVHKTCIENIVLQPT